MWSEALGLKLCPGSGIMTAFTDGIAVLLKFLNSYAFFEILAAGEAHMSQYSSSGLTTVL